MKKGIILLLFGMLSSCGNKDLYGKWTYDHVSNINGGTTYFEFDIHSDHTCQYNMRYTLLGRDIVNQTTDCTWKKDGDYIIYTSKIEKTYLYYDGDKLYTVDKDTKSIEWELTKAD